MIKKNTSKKFINNIKIDSTYPPFFIDNTNSQYTLIVTTTSLGNNNIITTIPAGTSQTLTLDNYYNTTITSTTDPNLTIQGYFNWSSQVPGDVYVCFFQSTIFPYNGLFSFSASINGNTQTGSQIGYSWSNLKYGPVTSSSLILTGMLPAPSYETITFNTSSSLNTPLTILGSQSSGLLDLNNNPITRDITFSPGGGGTYNIAFNNVNINYTFLKDRYKCAGNITYSNLLGLSAGFNGTNDQGDPSTSTINANISFNFDPLYPNLPFPSSNNVVNEQINPNGIVGYRIYLPSIDQAYTDPIYKGPFPFSKLTLTFSPGTIPQLQTGAISIINNSQTTPVTYNGTSLTILANTSQPTNVGSTPIPASGISFYITDGIATDTLTFIKNSVSVTRGYNTGSNPMTAQSITLSAIFDDGLQSSVTLLGGQYYGSVSTQTFTANLVSLVITYSDPSSSMIENLLALSNYKSLTCPVCSTIYIKQ